MLPCLLLALLTVACESPATQARPTLDVESRVAALDAEQRRDRAGQIRDAAFANGISQGYLLAGIADAETQLSHCWSS